MTSVATETWGLVFWEQRGSAYAAVTGPQSGTGTVPVPDEGTLVWGRGDYVDAFTSRSSPRKDSKCDEVQRGM